MKHAQDFCTYYKAAEIPIPFTSPPHRLVQEPGSSLETRAFVLSLFDLSMAVRPKSR